MRTEAVRKPWQTRPMSETSARLLRLLSLLQAHRDWSGADLADRLGVTPRTVRRDVGKLREPGYPVSSPGIRTARTGVRSGRTGSPHAAARPEVRPE